MDKIGDLIFTADFHIGLESIRFGASPEEWDSPSYEPVAYAKEVGGAVLHCGDLFNSRSPTTRQYIRGYRWFLAGVDSGAISGGISGNHDCGLAKDAVSTLWWTHLVATQYLRTHFHYPRPELVDAGGLQTITLPWPRLAEWLPEDVKGMSAEEQMVRARTRLMATLKGITDKLDYERPSILFGHAMVSYGGIYKALVSPTEEGLRRPFDPVDPGLMFGKDIVLSYDWLKDLPIGEVFLGHVHDPGMLGYVGSTQPTDWGEARQEKRFLHLKITDVSGGNGHGAGKGRWRYEVETVPYKTSLRLIDAEVFLLRVPTEAELQQQLLESWHDHGAPGQRDVARARVHIPEGANVTPTDVRRLLEPYAKRIESVEIIPPARQTARVETETPMAAMKPDEATRTWLRARETPEADEKEVVAILKTHLHSEE